MKVLVSGGTGLIGKELIKTLEKNGHYVKYLTRTLNNGGIPWNPEEGNLDSKALKGFDAVVHLAGENIAGKNPIQGRWTKERKDKIRESRVKGTRLLSETLAELENPPKVFISASAIGFYGDRGDEKLFEDSSIGKGFLAEVCQEWEKETKAAVEKGIRVVNTRFGVILSKSGGALASMLPPFKAGVGGILGDGKQYMSWISLEDAVRAIIYAIENESIKGAINIVAPNPVTNFDYTKILGKVINKPTIFPVPKFGIKLLFGEMGEELLLASNRVLPKKLLDSGFVFKNEHLAGALKSILA